MNSCRLLGRHCSFQPISTTDCFTTDCFNAWIVKPKQGIAPAWLRFTGSSLSIPGLTHLSLDQIPTVHLSQLIGFFDEASWQVDQGRLFELQPSLANEVCQQVGNT